MLSIITFDEGKNIRILVGIICIIILILLHFFGKRIPKKINNIITAVITIVVVAFGVYFHIITENFNKLDSLLIHSGIYLLTILIIKIVKKYRRSKEENEKQNHS